MTAGVGVEHAPAPECVGDADAAYHHAVAAGGQQRPLEAQLPEVLAEVHEPAGALAGAVVDVHALAVGGAAVQVEGRIDDVRGAQRASGRRQHIPA